MDFFNETLKVGAFDLIKFTSDFFLPAVSDPAAYAIKTLSTTMVLPDPEKTTVIV